MTGYRAYRRADHAISAKTPITRIINAGAAPEIAFVRSGGVYSKAGIASKSAAAMRSFLTILPRKNPRQVSWNDITWRVKSAKVSLPVSAKAFKACCVAIAGERYCQRPSADSRNWACCSNFARIGVTTRSTAASVANP